MTLFPHLTGGAAGLLKHHHLRDLFDEVEARRAQGDEEPTFSDLRERQNAKAQIFVVEITGQSSDTSYPMRRALSWREKAMLNATHRFAEQMPRSSIEGADNFARAAALTTLPYGLVIAVRDETGARQYGYMPPTQVHIGVIDDVVGDPNATYGASSLDLAVRRPGLLTPIDRFAGIDYIAQDVGDRCLLLSPTPDRVDIEMIAFETPDFAPCPAPFRGMTGLVDLESVVHL